MGTLRTIGTGVAACSILLGGLIALAQHGAAQEEQERAVKEHEVPKVALDQLRKLAGGAAIREFAEETEHGNKFYEGSWPGAHGNVDALVTESGDLVEIEEVVPSDQVPAAARAAVAREAGADAKLMCERKTMLLYEFHFKKGGKAYEMILTPDGRRYYEGDDEGADADEDED